MLAAAYMIQNKQYMGSAGVAVAAALSDCAIMHAPHGLLAGLLAGLLDTLLAGYSRGMISLKRFIMNARAIT
jgi:hypothetical protein